MPIDERLEIKVGDITQLDIDAIVNAANEKMLGGGGVDGAIHRAAGPGLKRECQRHPEVRPGVRCPTGEARITGGHDLDADHVIHTVGPVYKDGESGEPERLADAYCNSLKLAAEHDLDDIAFPCISTGVYGYPKRDAARIAIDTVRAFLDENDHPRHVIFCCYSDEDAAIYREILSNA